VGLPLEFDGSLGQDCVNVQRFIQQMQEHQGIPPACNVFWWDERFSTRFIFVVCCCFFFLFSLLSLPLALAPRFCSSLFSLLAPISFKACARFVTAEGLACSAERQTHAGRVGSVSDPQGVPRSTCPLVKHHKQNFLVVLLFSCFVVIGILINLLLLILLVYLIRHSFVCF